MYPVPHDGAGHAGRIAETIAFGQLHIAPDAMIVDLSTGTGEIPRGICPAGQLVLGDYAPGYEFTGPIDETALDVAGADAWVLCETLEHLEDPGHVLKLIRPRSVMLLLSTPVGCFDDTNPEHVWAWDREGVEGLCGAAGWTCSEYVELPGVPYTYGVWLLI
jgi:hypothetical protein